MDERVEGPAPIYEMFRKYNIVPLERPLRIAKDCGVERAVILGSYFAYFDRAWSELELGKRHPYILGAQPGCKPVWLFLVEQIQGMKAATLYPRGGSAMVAVNQVGQCIAGAVERNSGGHSYPIGFYNLTWKEMLAIVHKYRGVPSKRIVTIPNWMYALGGIGIKRAQKKAGHDGGQLRLYAQPPTRHQGSSGRPRRRPSSTSARWPKPATACHLSTGGASATP